jgi:hypothetical protein
MEIGTVLDATPLPPPANELFTKADLASRHPNLLNKSRVEWAVRGRNKNGLGGVGAVFEARGSQLLIHEPAFLAWFLGLTGRSKPRALRGRKPGKKSRELRRVR